MAEVFYCDNYEALTGRDRDGSLPEAGAVETKVVSAPEQVEPEAAAVEVETKDAE